MFLSFLAKGNKNHALQLRHSKRKHKVIKDINTRKQNNNTIDKFKQFFRGKQTLDILIQTENNMKN